MSDISFETVDHSSQNSGFIRGDVVKMYKESTALTYPCIILSSDYIEEYRIEALAGILGNRTLLEDGENYAVYINMQGETLQIGMVPTTRLKYILANSVFSTFEKRVHLDSQTTVVGDMLFALCVTEPDM